MTDSARSFKLSKPKSKEERDQEYPPLTYVFTDDEPADGWPVDEDGEPIIAERTLTAHYPGAGVFDVLLAQTGMARVSELEIAGSVFAALKQTFVDDGDYDYIRGKIETEELEVSQLVELIEDMIEKWTAFPTKRSSASTRSQRRSGGRSRGPVPSGASTPAPSASTRTASAT